MVAVKNFKEIAEGVEKGGFYGNRIAISKRSIEQNYL